MLTEFLKRVVPEPNSGCWLWDGPVSDRGYGYVYRQGERILAHRESYRLHGGEPGPLLRHTCDVPCCVNPAHLLPGTKSENMRDAVQRGRVVSRKGRSSQQPPKKLWAAAIHDIRRWQGPGQAMATKYAVDLSLIYQIRARKIWAHLPEE